MTTYNNPEDRGWGLWLAAGLIVAVIMMGILTYIGWLNYHTHVDTPNGDDVLEHYPITTAQAQSVGVEDWEELDASNPEIITRHAPGAEEPALVEGSEGD